MKFHKRAQTFEIFYLIAGIILVVSACVAVLTVKLALPTDVNTAATRIIEIDRQFDAQKLYILTSSQYVAGHLDIFDSANRTSQCTTYDRAVGATLFSSTCFMSYVARQYEQDFNEQMNALLHDQNLGFELWDKEVKTLESINTPDDQTHQKNPAITAQVTALRKLILQNAQVPSRDYFVSFKENPTTESPLGVNAIIVARQSLTSSSTRLQDGSAPYWQIDAKRDIYFSVPLNDDQQFAWNFFSTQLKTIVINVTDELAKFKTEKAAAKTPITDEDLIAFSQKVQQILYTQSQFSLAISSNPASKIYGVVVTPARKFIVFYPQLHLNLYFDTLAK